MRNNVQGQVRLSPKVYDFVLQFWDTKLVGQLVEPDWIPIVDCEARIRFDSQGSDCAAIYPVNEEIE